MPGRERLQGNCSLSPESQTKSLRDAMPPSKRQEMAKFGPGIVLCAPMKHLEAEVGASGVQGQPEL